VKQESDEVRAMIIDLNS